MREYEFTFVVQPEITDEGLQSLCEKLEGILERVSAIRLFYEDWGRRRLAYEIQKFQKGHYLVLHFLDQGKAVPELERAARLEDSVLRFLTVLADDAVTDVEARKAEAVKLEEERKQKAIERAAREAEEAAARAAEAEEAAARAAQASEARAAAEAEATEEPSSAGEAPEEAGDEPEKPREAPEEAADEPEKSGEAPAPADDAEEAEQPA